jgi:hypothetical protein
MYVSQEVGKYVAWKKFQGWVGCLEAVAAVIVLSAHAVCFESSKAEGIDVPQWLIVSRKECRRLAEELLGCDQEVVRKVRGMEEEVQKRLQLVNSRRVVEVLGVKDKIWARSKADAFPR